MNGLFWIFHINGIIQYVVLCVWLLFTLHKHFQALSCWSMCQYSISFYGRRISHCMVYCILLTHSSFDRMWVVSTFWLLRIMLIWIFAYKFFGGHVFISLGYIPRSRIVGSYGNTIFNILRNCPTVFPKWLHHFTFPTAMNEGCNFSTPPANLSFFFSF